MRNLSCRIPAVVILLLVALASRWDRAIAEDTRYAAPTDAGSQLFTNLAQVESAVKGRQGIVCAFALRGTVLAAESQARLIFLQDATSTKILEVDTDGRRFDVGQEIRVCGTNYVIPTEIGLSLGKRPLVENDGEHGEAGCIGTVDLKAGWHPIRLSWFNHKWQGSLKVSYSGPGFAQTVVPDAVLFHVRQDSSDSTNDLSPGLTFNCYEGEWRRLPNFRTLKPVRSGITSNFNVAVGTRTENVALVFDGFIKINRSGVYSFYVTSDDGSQLFIENTPVQVTVVGTNAVPAPQNMSRTQAGDLPPGDFWADAEGVVTFMGKQRDAVDLELNSGGSRLHVRLCDATGDLPTYLLGSRIGVQGICLDAATLDGHRLTDEMVVPGWNQARVLAPSPEGWSVRPATIAQCLSSNSVNSSRIVRFNGCVVSSGSILKLDDGTGVLPLELLNGPVVSGQEIECVGILNRQGATDVLRCAVFRPTKKSAIASENSAMLSTAAQVQQLKPEESKLYRAHLRGVVTWVAQNRDCIVLQDATRGVFVGLKPGWIWDAPMVGENLEIEGSCTSGDFSPFVILTRAKRLGMGSLPAPMHPTWDELIGGSMDSQFVEIRGLATKSEGDYLTLLMPGGKINVQCVPQPASPLQSFVKSVVRIRGCMFAKWDYTTRQVTLEHPLWFGGATVCVDIPPPPDPFEADRMSARELTQYDVQRNFFRRVRVSGQVLGGRDGVYFLNDSGSGVRFQTVDDSNFAPGDVVDVVGLVELGGPSPMLREAVARKTGISPLPPAIPLNLDATNITYDARRVWTTAKLIEAKNSGAARVLEMQDGLKTFIVRMAGTNHPAAPWPAGSQLKVAGVFADLGGISPGRQTANSFELLVNSLADITLIARPPWWTLPRLLGMIAVLAAGLSLAFIWISVLRRQVERRTKQLQIEIGERKRAEQERAIEQERSRIARDLHDDLGSRLTVINMLAMTGRGTALGADASLERLQLIGEKARSTVATLEGLVWAVNPKNDTVAGLCQYLASCAEEMLARSSIACRVELPTEFPSAAIPADTRHNVLLAAQEALNNAIRHSNASEVLLRVKVEAPELQIVIQDNGRGFDPARRSGTGNGLSNLHERMLRVHGRCSIDSTPGNGTVVTLSLPFN